MLKRALIATLLTTTFASTGASAEFVHTDWKVAGDKQAVLHTSTGQEWLNLEQTANKSVNTVISLLDTQYAGWRLPTFAEFETMISTFAAQFNASHTPSAQLNAPMVNSFINLFSTRTSNQYNMGTYQAQNGTYKFVGVYFGSDIFYGLEHPTSYGANTIPFTGTGVWLVSDGGTTLSSMQNPTLNINNVNAPVNQVSSDVSAPAGLAAAGLIMMILGSRRKPQ